MSPFAQSLVPCAAAFLLGSIPFGLLIARLFRVSDLTHQGSGNIGATNVSRVVGFWPAGFLTFVLDLLKGALPVVLATETGTRLIQSLTGLGVYPVGPSVLAWIGTFAVVGHCYSPWLKFKGGKGVATGFGALLMLSPWAAVLGAVTFAFVFAFHRISSLASLTGLLVVGYTHLMIYPIQSAEWPGLLLLFVILLRHSDNISALLEQREARF